MFVLYLGGGSAAHGNRVLLNDESDDAPVILVLSEVQLRKPLCLRLVKDYYSFSGQSGMVIEMRRSFLCNPKKRDYSRVVG